MDIVCSIDNNYVQHCCVMLTSFFENNKEEGNVIHLLTEGITEDNKKTIEELIHAYKGEFCYYLVNSEIVASFPIKEGDHLTIATYYRLLMADILPQSIDKILYLDCDIIINDSITELWNTSLDGYAMAAIEELGCSLPDVYKRLGYDKKYGYFNAGVLLINLQYWREHNLTREFLLYIAENYEKLKAHDQDVLNALLHKKCLHVSYKWNVEEAFYHYSVMKRLKHNRELRFVLRHPTILHYTWKPKPWDLSCKQPFRINYYIYLQRFAGSSLNFKRKLAALFDKYVFCFFLWINLKGHRYYKL